MLLECKKYTQKYNDVRRLCFGDALLPALFCEKVYFFRKKLQKIGKNEFIDETGVSTLRVGRIVTRLTVHWA